MILRPDGILAKRNVLAMSQRQVGWFMDPHALLRHLSDLGSVKVAAYCVHCYERGLPEDVSAVFNPESRQWTVHCSCADYPPIKDRGDGPMTIDKPNADGTSERIVIRSVDELLIRLGWSFRCAGDCSRLGLADGVEGGNDERNHTLSVKCGCTERIYLSPRAARPS